jgi:predicted AAA+ superfamily ATPase
MEVLRPFWEEKLQRAWSRVPIAWLSGVRRVGKTTLARSLDQALYLSCDLPSTADRVADPERFLRSVEARVLILDEIHQLSDPSRLLKIAADAFPRLKVLATGSSTLAATQKFRDSLTGRKQMVHLQPVLMRELAAFGVKDLRRRLLHGGLPPALLAEQREPEFYAEWLDSFYARDVQELFRVEKRSAFLRLVELLLRQSGGLCDFTSIARACELSRPTVMNYVEVLQVTHAVTLLRPYHGSGKQELVRQPKVYGFDSGFVAYCRGWNELRPDDCGLLWEHLVLETLTASSTARTVHYWRDKQQREVDFILPAGRNAADAIECKWSVSSFDPKGLSAFRESHSAGRNFVVVPDLPAPLERKYGKLKVTHLSLEALEKLLDAK